MIGKIIADFSGLTEKLDGQKNEKHEEIHKIDYEVNSTEWDKFKQEVKAADGDTVKIKAIIDDTQLKKLKNVDGLYDYAVDQSKAGKDIDLDSVNSLITDQNFKNIADQAHGLIGVNKAIDEYNNSLKKNEDNTTSATASTEKFIEILSTNNSKLADCMANANGSSIKIGDYAKSLATATVKTVALEIATTALNAVISMGISIIVTGLITAIDSLIHRQQRLAESAETASENIKNIKSSFNDLKKTTGDITQEFAELSQHVDQVTGKNKDLSTESYERFLELSNQLAESLPNVGYTIDEDGNKIVGLTGTIDEITQSINNLVDAERLLSNQEIDQNMDDVFDKALWDLQTYHGELENIKENSSEFMTNTKEMVKKLLNGDSLDFNIKNETNSKLFSDLQELFDDVGLKLGTELGGKISLNHNAEWAELSDEELKQLEASADRITHKYSEIAGDLSEQMSDVKNNIENTLNGLSSYLNSWVTTSFDYNTIIQAYGSDLGVAIQESINSINWSEVEGINNWDDAKQWIENNILEPLKDVKNSGIREAYIQLFTNTDIPIDSAISYLEEIEQYYKDNEIEIPVVFTKKKEEIKDVKNRFDKKNSSFTSGNVKGLNDFFKDNGIDEEDEYERWLTVTEGIADATEAMEAWNNAQQKSDSSTSKIFSEAWKGLKNETKDALLELAKSGELTAKTFKETKGADDFLKQIKMSATKAKTEVQNLLTVQEKLSAFSQGAGSLETAYNEFKDNKFVSAETLESLPDAFKSLKEYDLFSKIVGDPTSGKEKIKKAFDDIVTAYLKDQNTLVGVTEKNKNAVIANLKRAGISNAEEVVDSYIKSVNESKDLILAAENELNAKSQKERKRDLENFQEALKDKDTSFADACKVLGENNAALMTSLGKNYADDYINWCKLCEEKVKAYNEMVDAINKAGDASTIGNPLVVDQSKAFKQKYKMTPQQYIKKYGNVKSLLNSVNKMYKSGDADNVLPAVVDEARAIINSEKASNKEKNAAKNLVKYAKAHLNLNTSSYNPKSSSTKKDKSNSKQSTQEIDWIDRRLTSINNKLSLIKAQYENIASSVKGSNIDTIVNKQNNNLSTQITLLKRLYATSARAASKYSKKASKIKISSNKKADKKLKNLVKNEAAIGKNTSYKTLVKKYGQSTADKISNYRDYYDKARSSKQSAQEYKQQINQAKIQKQQNLADKYQSYIDNHAARSEVNNKAGLKDNDLTLQHSAKEKENSIKKQISYTNKLYAAQKEIAKLEGNNQKVAQLEAERRKAIVDLQIQSLENYAGEAEAAYNLKQTQASMTTDYKTKNALSKQSLTSLKSQYNTLIKIAKKQGDIVEASRLNLEYQQKADEELKQRIFTVSEDYDKKLIGNDRQMQVWENAASLAEANGKTVNSGFYKNMLKIAHEDTIRREEERASAREEYKKLLKEDPNFINKPQWYDAVKELNEIENGLEQARITEAKKKQQVIKADWAVAESAQNTIDNLNSEAETYKTILGYKDMFDKDGVITDAGTATLALDVYEIDNNITKIQKFNEEINKLNKLYSEGEISVEEYDAQMKVLRDGLADSTSEIYTQRDAMKSIIEEGLNAELDALNKMIDKIKENLSDASSLREYQKNIEKQTKNIASLERQIMAKGGDTSEQGRATVQKLKAQLEEAQSDLEDTEYDKYIQDQERILDDLSDDFQDYLDAQLDQIDALLNGIMTSVESGDLNIKAAIDQVEKTIGVDLSTALSESLTLFASTGKNNSNDVYDNTVDAYNNSANGEYNAAKNTPVIDTYNKSGADEQQAIKDAREKDIRQAEEQKEKEQKAIEDRTKANNNYADKIAQIFSKVREYKNAEEYSTSTLTDYGSQKFAKNNGKGYKKFLSMDNVKKIDEYVKKIVDAKTGKTLYTTAKGANTGEKVYNTIVSLDKKYNGAFKNAVKTRQGSGCGISGFANGGVVDGNSYYGDKLIARINSGESVLTKEFTDMLPNTVDIMKGFTDLYQQPDLSQYINTSPSQQNVNVGEVNVVLEGSNVTDFDSFAHTLQHSPKARNILQDVFTSGLTGDSNAYMRR